jgi:DNA-binding CsgD family transcriptional regulator
LQAFSNTVRDIYALAEYANPDQFLHRAIELLQSWIRFDGVVFGTGEPPAQSNVFSPFKSEDNDTADAKTELEENKFEGDPVAHGFRNAPHSPVRGGIREIYRKGKETEEDAKTKRKTKNKADLTVDLTVDSKEEIKAEIKAKGRRVAGVRSLAEELGLCHLLVHGDNPAQAKPARWIVLYRAQDVRFSQMDAACLHSLWTHLSRAIVINRTRSIERQYKKADETVSGLISMQGIVDIADARFFDMLELEWPELAPQTIPEAALECLRLGKVFRGTQIEISLARQQGFNVCRIRPINAQEVLTPREFVVARRFAAGMSHKQIARELGVSHHTIRNQLAHLYRKLNLHDKDALADYLALNVLLK